MIQDSFFVHGPKKMSAYSDIAKIDGLRVGVYQTRLTVTLVMAIHFFAFLFIEGPYGYMDGFKFFTCWSETFTLLYFVYLMYSNPFTVNIPQRSLVFEHAILLCQLTVVLVYWIILMPNLGLGAAPQIKYFAIYLHTVPFLGNF